MNTDLKIFRHGGKRLQHLGEEITELCRKLDRDALVDALANIGEAEKIAGNMYKELKQIIAERDEERSWPR
jgi:hypothetical protein